MRQQALDADRRAVVYAPGERSTFRLGDHVRILSRTLVAPHRIACRSICWASEGRSRASSGFRRSTTTKTLSPEGPSQSRTTTVSQSQ